MVSIFYILRNDDWTKTEFFHPFNFVEVIDGNRCKWFLRNCVILLWNLSSFEHSTHDSSHLLLDVTAFSQSSNSSKNTVTSQAC